MTPECLYSISGLMSHFHSWYVQHYFQGIQPEAPQKQINNEMQTRTKNAISKYAPTKYNAYLGD